MKFGAMRQASDESAWRRSLWLFFQFGLSQSGLGFLLSDGLFVGRCTARRARSAGYFLLPFIAELVRLAGNRLELDRMPTGACNLLASDDCRLLVSNGGSCGRIHTRSPKGRIV